MHLFGIAFSLILLHFTIVASESCSNVFSYVDEGNWVGRFEIDADPKDLWIQVKVHMVIDAEISEASGYDLVLVDQTADTTEPLKGNITLRYKTVFSSAWPLPKIIKIEIKCETICSDTFEKSENFSYEVLTHNVFPRGTEIGQQIENRLPCYSDIVTSTTPSSTRTITQSTRSNRIKGKTIASNTTYDQCGVVDERFNVAPLVAGGTIIRKGAWPWLISIYVDQGDLFEFRCGGNLISKKHVLTAAHCLITPRGNYTKNSISVFAGRHSIRNWNNDGFTMHRVEKIFIPDDYKIDRSSHNADIAVVVLTTLVRFTNLVRPVCLWSGPSEVARIEGKIGRIVGWGINEKGKFNALPRKINVNIVSNEDCRSNNTDTINSIENSFCAKAVNDGSLCSGDSGNGLMILQNGVWILRGTASVSMRYEQERTCSSNAYLVFADLAPYIDWIQNIIADVK